jgi:hypothetical protein
VRRLFLMLTIGVVVAFAACGGDDDASPTGGPSAPATNAPSNGDSSAASSPDSDTGYVAGVAGVVAGDESFVFEIECQFGTGIIRGPGQSLDGTPAYVVMGMPVSNDGSPKDAPGEVDIQVEVGKNTLLGPSLYVYAVRSSTGSVSQYSDDGNHAEGTIQLEYRDNDGAKDGLSYGDLVDGSFTATCP